MIKGKRMNLPIIQVNKLTKQYPGANCAALKGVSFDVYPGEIFSLLGPNGAGKTTAISILTGLMEATSGEVRLCGYSIATESLLVKKNIGVVPQEIALYPMISALQNLNFFGRIYGLRGDKLKNNVNKVLAQVNLTERQNDKVEQLSGGMQRRLNIAVALLHEPKVLFMDEPTVGIDPQNRIYILDTIKALKEQGMCIFYTSHYMEEVQEISDRIGVIDNGDIVALGSHRELIGQVEQLHTVSFDIDSKDKIESLNFDDFERVNSAFRNGLQIKLQTDEPNEIIVPVLNTLKSKGIGLRNLTIESPNLETVFLKLTGNQLRD